MFDEHGHRKNALVKAQGDDVAMTEMPDDESLDDSFSCGDSWEEVYFTSAIHKSQQPN